MVDQRSLVSRIGWVSAVQEATEVEAATPRATWNKLPSNSRWYWVCHRQPRGFGCRQKRERQWVVFWRPASAPSQARSSAASPEAFGGNTGESITEGLAREFFDDSEQVPNIDFVSAYSREPVALHDRFSELDRISEEIYAARDARSGLGNVWGADEYPTEDGAQDPFSSPNPADAQSNYAPAYYDDNMGGADIDDFDTESLR